jgi:Flp pilus assembly CpaE family ATPase
VGTTLVCVNVAVLLAQRNKSVVLAELRPWYGAAPLQLGIAAGESSLLQTSPDDINSRTVGKCLLPHASGVRVLTQSTSPDAAGDFSPEQAAALTGVLSRMAEYAIVDLSHHSAATLRATVALCDYVAIVAGLDAISLASAHRLLETLRSWGVGAAALGAVIVNHLRSTSSINLAAIRQNLDCGIVGMIPPEPEECDQSLATGVPIVLAHPESTVSRVLVDLADRLTADQIAPLTF